MKTTSLSHSNACISFSCGGLRMLINFKGSNHKAMNIYTPVYDSCLKKTYVNEQLNEKELGKHCWSQKQTNYNSIIQRTVF